MNIRRTSGESQSELDSVGRETCLFISAMYDDDLSSMLLSMRLS